jgi:hypothetical protein
MFSVGGSISYGGTRGDGFQFEHIDAKEVMGSAFGVLHGRHRLPRPDPSAAGSQQLRHRPRTSDRRDNRTESGDTSASHLAAELGAACIRRRETSTTDPSPR